jgi:hypothetical protein
MAGFTPNEGEKLIAQLIHLRTHADRPADLELGLFVDVAADESITEATITEPTGGSYARKTLTDGSWSIVDSVASYAQQTFTASGSAMTPDVYGYFIATTSGGTQRLLYVEIDGAGPYDIVEDATYDVTPNVTVG